MFPTRSLTAQRAGAIYSPQYPSNYPNSINSVLTLRIPANYIITLWFDSFQMESKLPFILIAYVPRLYKVSITLWQIFPILNVSNFIRRLANNSDLLISTLSSFRN